MLERAATWAEATTFESLPGDVIHHAKRAIVDWFAAAVPGGVMPPSRVLRKALVDGRETGGAALVPGGERVGPRTAALINGTAAHTAEVDDIFRDGVYHPGAPTIAAALAVAQDRGRMGRDLICAIVVGYEVSTRVAATIQPAHYRFWHTTGTVGTLGAAAAVARMLDLDATRFAHAVATSVTMAAGLQQAFRSDSMSKPMHSGHAADAGSLAALAAEQGFTGALDILHGDAGFGAAMSDAPAWTTAFADLGDVFNITSMTLKNHACCGHTFAAIDGALEFRTDHDLHLADVERVEVATYKTAIDVAGNPDPVTDFEAKFSIPYCVAAALTLGSVRLDAFEAQRLRDKQLRDLADRVSMSVHPDLDAAFPKQRGAELRVMLRDGTMHTVFRPTRKGDPDLPLSDDDLSDKYEELVTPHLGIKAARSLANALWSLDGVDDLAELTPVAEEQAG